MGLGTCGCGASSACGFTAAVFLPAGAAITSIQLEACDTNSSAAVTADLAQQDAVSGQFTQLAQVSTGQTETPGCARTTQALATPTTVDNSAVATFSDVPTTHPFFPFIEALVAAGITGGCNVSPPMYCPDQVVTRGQMAKFLSIALGLHWAP